MRTRSTPFLLMVSMGRGCHPRRRSSIAARSMGPLAIFQMDAQSMILRLVAGEAALLCQLAVVVGSRGGVRVVVQRVHVVAVKLDLAPGFAPADDGPAPSETAAMSCALRGEVRVRLAAQVGEGREAAGSHRKVGELDVAAHVALLVAHRGELAGDGHGWDLRGGGRGWAGRARAGGRLVGPSLLTCVVRRASQTRSP